MAMFERIVSFYGPLHLSGPISSAFFGLDSCEHRSKGSNGGVERSLRVETARVLESVVDLFSCQIFVEGAFKLRSKIG